MGGINLTKPVVKSCFLDIFSNRNDNMLNTKDLKTNVRANKIFRALGTVVTVASAVIACLVAATPIGIPITLAIIGIAAAVFAIKNHSLIQSREALIKKEETEQIIMEPAPYRKVKADPYREVDADPSLEREEVTQPISKWRLPQGKGQTRAEARRAANRS